MHTSAIWYTLDVPAGWTEVRLSDAMTGAVYAIVVSKIYAPPENILLPVIALTALVLINIFGTIRIVSWIKDGKI